MKALSMIQGIAAVLPRDNIDTDAIIPQRYLITIDKEGMAEGLFGDWRWTDDGSPDPGFVLNRPGFLSTRILIAGANYGCGSSREHAVWAHLACGIDAVIASSFGPIFAGNAAKNGLLLIALPADQVTALSADHSTEPAELVIDLTSQTIKRPDGTVLFFEIEAQHRSDLLRGADELIDSRMYEAAIAAFQARDRALRPWVWNER